MKRMILLFALMVGSQLYAKELKAYVLYNSSGKTVDIDDLMKATNEKRFIFFGEYHNNPISHWLQFEVTKRLYTMAKSRLMLGAEMFESDNQYIIDEYLSGKISEKNFQAEVRLWPNYDTDYKPLMEFAKEKGLRFIATNIPRRYANMCYKQGLDSLKTLSPTALGFIAPLATFEFDSSVACYSKMINEMGHGGYNMALAQAMKDATMAHFILSNVDNRNVFLHYNGAYHSDNKEGIVYYLKKQVDESKIMTITTVTQENTDKLAKENEGLADFIICVPETMTTTH
ncbi:MAG: ChaN family lipoprotein [Crocinitomicaceae bacterium]|nr:ChaN family lipoprotein [Crocinitomicaceae bacterium]